MDEEYDMAEAQEWIEKITNDPFDGRDKTLTLNILHTHFIEIRGHYDHSIFRFIGLSWQFEKRSPFLQIGSSDCSWLHSEDSQVEFRIYADRKHFQLHGFLHRSWNAS